MKNAFYLFLCLIPLASLSQTNIKLNNSGAKIIIKDACSIKVVDGSFVNKSNNSSDGKIKLEGTLSITGDWDNQTASADVFINGSSGYLVFDGQLLQNVYGTLHSKIWKQEMILMLMIF